MTDEAFELPIDGILDLHTFQPRDYPALLEDYLGECVRAGFAEVRIVHGKGTGFQRRRVRDILSQLPMVASYRDAPPQAGGWGATVVFLKPLAENPKNPA